MSETGLRYWFLIDHKDNREDITIVPAANVYEVVDRYEGAIGEAEIVRLTWSQLSKLTGCIIPSICKPLDWATGGFMFHRDGNMITIWI